MIRAPAKKGTPRRVMSRLSCFGSRYARNGSAPKVRYSVALLGSRATERRSRNTVVEPTRNRQTMLQSTWRIHSVARQPLDAVWMVPNSTIAGATSMKTSSTPSRMSPPAIPKMPDMKDVERIVTAMTASANASCFSSASLRFSAPTMRPTTNEPTA